MVNVETESSLVKGFNTGKRQPPSLVLSYGAGRCFTFRVPLLSILWLTASVPPFSLDSKFASCSAQCLFSLMKLK